MIIKSPVCRGSLFKIINLITPTNINYLHRYLSPKYQVRTHLLENASDGYEVILLIIP